MLGQIWSAITRRPQPTELGAQLDPIVKYRLSLYLTTTSAGTSSEPNGATGAAYFGTVTIRETN